MMSFDAGAYRLLSYSGPVGSAAKSSLVEIRQDARALMQQSKKQPSKKAKQDKPAPPLFSLPGLANLLSSVFGWLFPPAPAPTPQQPTPQPSQPGRATKFVVSSFNILGSSHTAPGGDAKGYASGTTRIRWAAELLAQKHVDVVGFQEMNEDQAIAFKQAAGDTYGLYPGNKGAMMARNSIAWRKDTWDFVKGYTVRCYSHRGNLWPVPVVLLKNKQTGQKAYFTNFHNAPGFHKNGAQQVWRDKATDQQVALVNKLKRETGLPVIVTGDMNEKDQYYKRMTREAGMHAANEGPNGRAPKRMGIDWIFGSEGVSFKRYFRERGALERKISDHGMILSEARIGGRG